MNPFTYLAKSLSEPSRATRALRGETRIQRGDRFTRLVTVGKRQKNKWQNAMWWCKCDCGKKIFARESMLMSGATKSCGCYRVDLARINIEKNRAMGLPRRADGRFKTAEEKQDDQRQLSAPH